MSDKAKHGATYDPALRVKLSIVKRARALGFEAATQAVVVRGVWWVSDRSGCVWRTLNQLSVL